MLVQHTRSSGKRLTYTIETDRRGNYTISLGAKVLKHGHDARYGHNLVRASKKLEAEAIERARRDIETLTGMEE